MIIFRYNSIDFCHPKYLHKTKGKCVFSLRRQPLTLALCFSFFSYCIHCIIWIMRCLLSRAHLDEWAHPIKYPAMYDLAAKKLFAILQIFNPSLCISCSIYVQLIALQPVSILASFFFFRLNFFIEEREKEKKNTKRWGISNACVKRLKMFFMKVDTNTPYHYFDFDERKWSQTQSIPVRFQNSRYKEHNLTFGQFKSTNMLPVEMFLYLFCFWFFTNYSSSFQDQSKFVRWLAQHFIRKCDRETETETLISISLWNA